MTYRQLKKKKLKTGEKVFYGSFPGTVQREYDKEYSIYEVRLPGGIIATGSNTLRKASKKEKNSWYSFDW